MRSVTSLLLLVILLVEVCPTVAWGDGGAVRLVEQQGDLRISAFTSPNPLRAGPVDVSVLVQKAASGQLITQAEVLLTITCRNAPNVVLRSQATTEAATNKLLRAVSVLLSQPGWWDVDVDCVADGQTARVRFAMEAGPPLPEWLTVWPWFAWPAGAVLVFSVHRSLVFRRQSALVAATRGKIVIGPVQRRSDGRVARRDDRRTV